MVSALRSLSYFLYFFIENICFSFYKLTPVPPPSPFSTPPPILLIPIHFSESVRPSLGTEQGLAYKLEVGLNLYSHVKVEKGIPL